MSGLLSAVTEAIGEADAEIAGRRLTRLRSPTAIAGPDLEVESAVGWEASGKVAIDGVGYTYASRTDDALIGIAHTEFGVTTPGAKQVHAVEASVLDVTRAWSALDQVRRALLVDYAQQADLDVVGRNLGVERLPMVTDDDLYREIVKALAYASRGTVYSLELALNALLGPGNWEIEEDPILAPRRVPIAVPASVGATDTHIGRAFLAETRRLLSSSDTEIDCTNPPLTVGSVKVAEVSYLTRHEGAKPSADVREVYEGVNLPLWTYTGSFDENWRVTIVPQGIKLVGGASYTGLYTASAAGAYQVLGGVFGGVITVNGIFGPLIDDGVIAVGATIIDAAGWHIQLTDGAGAVITPGAGVTIDIIADISVEIAITKDPQGLVSLLVNQQVVESYDYSALGGGGTPRMLIGTFGAAGNLDILSSIFYQYVHDSTEYWDLPIDDALVTAVGNTLETTTDRFVASDVGSRLDITGAIVLNAEGGTNRGRYFISVFTDARTVAIEGFSGEAATVDGTAITIGDRIDAFQYPDDLGKEIVISGSTLGNDGTYVIEQLTEPGTGVNYADYDSPIREVTSQAVLSAVLTPEAGLTWQVIPVLEIENPLDCVLSDAGSVAGTVATLRSGRALPAANTVVEVLTTQVPSAQLLASPQVPTVETSAGPPRTMDHYPFYVTDPTSYVDLYLDNVTAAGITAVFKTQE